MLGLPPYKTFAPSCPNFQWPISKGLKLQHLLSTWFGKACHCLLMDVSYFIDSDWQQVILPEIIHTPVENTLQPAARLSDGGLLP